MVVFMGLVLLVWFACSTVKGGLFRPLFFQSKIVVKSYNENLLDEDEFVEKSEEIGLKLLGALVLSIVIYIINIVFMLCALRVDPYLYPTVSMLVWIVGSFIRARVDKTEKERLANIDRSKPSNRTRFTSFICLAYVVYILVLIIMTI